MDTHTIPMFVGLIPINPPLNHPFGHIMNDVGRFPVADDVGLHRDLFQLL